MTVPYGELYIVDDWVSVTEYIRQRPDVTIERGYANENSSPRSSTFDGVWNDPDGRWNRRNPMGPHHGRLGKNMPYRFGIDILADEFTRTETNTWGAVGNAAGDAWVNGTSSGGTVSATDWSVDSGTARHSLPAAAAVRVSELSPADRLFIDCEVRDTVTCPVNNVTGTGAIAAEVRFRCLDQSNFVALVLQFATDETTRLGVYERIAGVDRSLLAYTAIGDLSTLTIVTYELAAQIEGNVVRGKVWEAGTAEPRDWQVFTQRATERAGYLSIASTVAAGNANTKPLVVQHDNLSVRIPAFTGEIPTLGKRTDDSTFRSKKVLVQAGGIMQRQGQGEPPELSAMTRQRGSSTGWANVGTMTAVESVGSFNQVKVTDADAADDAVGYRYLILDKAGDRKEDTLFTITGKSSSGGFTTCTFTPDAWEAIETGDLFVGHRLLTAADAAVAYWPCEDGSDSTAIASALPGGEAMTIRYAVPNFASESSFQGSESVLKFNDAEITASVPDYDNSAGATSVVFVVSFPDSDEAASGTDIIQFFTTGGDGWSYDIQYETAGAGSLELQVFNTAGTNVFTSTVDFGLRGGAFQITMVFRQSAPTTVTYQAFVIKADGSVLSSTGPHTITGITTFGKITRIAGNPGGGYQDVGFGHLMILPTQLSSNLNLLDDFTGRNREPAQHRLQRACEEAGIPFSYRSDRDIVTSRMGTQPTGQLLDLIEDCPIVDLGLLYEPKGAWGIEYCTRGALSNQVPILTLSLADGEIQPDWVPDDDDRYLRNYIKVDRPGGSSYIAEETEGSLSTAEYPDGAGRYPGGGTINVDRDTALEGQAWWRLHLGTVDEDRIARLTVTPNATVTVERLFSVNIGHRIVITDVQDADVYEDISLIVLGYTLRFDTQYRPVFTFNCVPESPYRIFTWDDDEYGRWHPTDSALREDLNTTETDVNVYSLSAHWTWTTDAADFPFDIIVGGEVMTVTNVTDTGPPTSQQTFTVVRSVNGVVKEHSLDTPVDLFHPNHYGL